MIIDITKCQRCGFQDRDQEGIVYVNDPILFGDFHRLCYKCSVHLLSEHGIKLNTCITNNEANEKWPVFNFPNIDKIRRGQILNSCMVCRALDVQLKDIMFTYEGSAGITIGSLCTSCYSNGKEPDSETLEFYQKLTDDDFLDHCITD